MAVLALISSMATRQLLADRAAAFTAQSGVAVNTLSIGGVDAARRIEQGESFDVVVLARDAIDRLGAAQRLLPGSAVDWVRSEVAMAVKAGGERPVVSSADAVRSAVQRAARIGYSTGPSGVAIEALLRSWGMAEEFDAKAVRSAPGVPVAAMVARGDVDLGFQQLSEMLDVPGIDILGTLPSEIGIVTTFAAAVCRSAAAPDSAAAFVRFLTEPSAAEHVRRHGMDLMAR